MLEPDVGHLSYKVTTHLLAGILTIEHIVQTIPIVLPKCEGEAIWHHDRGTFVIPLIPQKSPKVHFCSLPSFFDLNRKRIASAIVIREDIGSWKLRRGLESDVGHLSDKVATHLLAGTITIERLVHTSLIWVLPQCEGIFAWHHDRGTLVVPTIAQDFLELRFCNLLTFLKLNGVRVASAITIYEDIGSR